MSKSTLSNQIDTLISRVILDLESKKINIISPAWVASEVDKEIDPAGLSPTLKTYASTMQIRESVRRQLAKRHDPIQRAKDFAGNETCDLFSDKLQAYYPIKITLKNGERQPVYTLLENLTDQDVTSIAGRMDRAGDSLKDHSRALRGWSRTRSHAKAQNA